MGGLPPSGGYYQVEPIPAAHTDGISATTIPLVQNGKINLIRLKFN